MIKLMDGGLMDFSPLPRRKTGDAHQVFHNVQRSSGKLLFDGWNSSFPRFHDFILATCCLFHIFIRPIRHL